MPAEVKVQINEVQDTIYANGDTHNIRHPPRLSQLFLVLLRPDIIVHNRRDTAQEPCESRGGRSGLPVPNSPYGHCGRKATLNLKFNLDS